MTIFITMHVDKSAILLNIMSTHKRTNHKNAHTQTLLRTRMPAYKCIYENSFVFLYACMHI